MTVTSPPSNAYLAAPTRKIGAANGFLFQMHAEFARDVDAFLTE